MNLYPAFYARVFRWALRSFLRFTLDIRVHFQEPLPPGPKVFAGTPPTVWDAFPILSFVRTDFVRTLVEEQIWSFFLPRLIFTLANQIVLYRGEKSARSIEDALFMLGRGDSVLIAPEGERTASGQRVRARRGGARLAVAGRAMVIPGGAWVPRGGWTGSTSWKARPAGCFSLNQALDEAAPALVLARIVVLPDRLDLGVALQLRVVLRAAHP